MTEPRFTVKEVRTAAGHGWRYGWVVADRGEVITILYANYAEALQHRDNIAKLYARWGFV